MRRTLPIILALLVGCAASTVMRDIVPARAQGQGGPSYEFLVLDCPKAAEQAKAGREGWHLAAVAPLVSEGTTTCASWFFDRQLPR